MPQAAVTALQAFLVGGISNAALAFAAKVFVYAASAYLLNRAAQAMAPKQKSPGGIGRGMETNFYDSGSGIRIIYGTVRTGGMETIPPMLNDADNSFLSKLLTHTGHEVSSFGDVYFDADVISYGAIDPVSYSPSNTDGRVNTGKYQDVAFIRRYTGAATDSSDAMLNYQFSYTGIAKGFSKTAVTFRYNDKVYRGIPVVTVVIHGKKCYDPRLDSSPGADPTNPAYSAYTNSPPLCLCDYLMATYGGEYDAADIDWNTVVTAANYCDALVNIPGPATQKRYTCNGVLDATAEFPDNVKTLVDAMLGRLIFRDGKWRVYAGSWQSPTFTIQKSDWISGLSIKFEQGMAKRFNRMLCWYIDAERQWQRVQCMPRSNATYKTADGEIGIDAQTEQFLCTTEHEAQRKAEFLLRQSRNQIVVTGRLPPRFQDLALWDTGTIVFDHLGWSSKTFRIVGVDMQPDGSMDCVFAEEQSSDWTDLDAADYSSPSTTALPATNVTSPTAPVDFRVTPNVNGTLLFRWQPPVVSPFGMSYEVTVSTNSADASVGSVVWRGTAETAEFVAPYASRWYYVRALANSVYGPYSPNTFGVHGLPIWIRSPEFSDPVFTDGDFDQSTAATSYWNASYTSSAGGLPLGWLIDTTSGFTHGRSSALLHTNALGSANELIPARINKSAVSFLREAQIHLAYARESVNTANFNLVAYARFLGNKSSSTSYGLVNTTVFVNSLSVGQWRTDIFSVTMPNSEINELTAYLRWDVNSHGSSNTGRSRVGRFQVFMS